MLVVPRLKKELRILPHQGVRCQCTMKNGPKK